MRIIFPKFYALIEEEEERKNRPQNFVSHLLFAGHERLAVQLLVSSRRKVTSFESVSERGHVDLCVREKMSFFYEGALGRYFQRCDIFAKTQLSARVFYYYYYY